MKKIMCNILGHSFCEWHFIPDVACTLIRECTRCGIQVTLPVPHKFNQWQYHSEHSCQESRICQQCGKKEVRTHHLWTTDGDNPDYCYRRRCLRCGMIEELLHELEYYGETEKVIKKNDAGAIQWNEVAQYSNYICRHCGKVFSRVSSYTKWVEEKQDVLQTVIPSHQTTII
jgi:hypothetical protein